MIDSERLRGLVPDLIRAIGEDPEREGLRDTPRRIAEMYAEIFSGIGKDPRDVLRVGFEEGYDEMVVLRDIPFTSMCEHHFLPFTGKAHVSYLPRGRVVGLSKLARAVEIVARRPQLQERLTSQVADAIQEALDPLGVGVVVVAEHLCLAMRGIKKPGSTMVTSALRGVFKSDARTRAEFLAFVRER